MKSNFVTTAIYLITGLLQDQLWPTFGETVSLTQC